MQINFKRFTDVDVSDTPKTGVGGLFHVELIHAATGLVKRQWSFPNLITDVGLNGMMGAGSSSFLTLTTFMGVGTSNVTPALSDTTLGAQAGTRISSMGGISDATANSLVSPEWFSVKTTREFGTTNGNGNLTELGLFSAVSGGTMWCRALFKDGAGTPITVTKTSADILRVTYEFRVYPALGDATQASLVISGITYGITWRPITNQLWRPDQWSDTGQGINAIASAVLGIRATLHARLDTNFGYSTQLNAGSVGTTSWNSATRVQTRQATWTPAQGAISASTLALSAFISVAGERSIYQGLVTPAFNKTAANQLVLNYTQQYDRVTP